MPELVNLVLFNVVPHEAFNSGISMFYLSHIGYMFVVRNSAVNFVVYTSTTERNLLLLLLSKVASFVLPSVSGDYFVYLFLNVKYSIFQVKINQYNL